MPLLMVAAVELDSPRRRVAAVTVGGVLLLAYSFTAFLHAYIP